MFRGATLTLAAVLSLTGVSAASEWRVATQDGMTVGLVEIPDARIAVVCASTGGFGVYFSFAETPETKSILAGTELQVTLTIADGRATSFELPLARGGAGITLVAPGKGGVAAATMIKSSDKPVSVTLSRDGAEVLRSEFAGTGSAAAVDSAMDACT